jgi:Fe-S-cluster containining protein
MDRLDAFSYACHQCGRCCREQVITLSPYDVLRIARAVGLSTGETVRRYTSRRGSILRFRSNGECVALQGALCGIHRGRPPACRLYPLGLERDANRRENFVRLEAAAGSRGSYGQESAVATFLESQGAIDYFAMNSRYEALTVHFRERIAQLVDFERMEPREFRRVAMREALAESDYDPNALIDATFDADGIGCHRDSDAETVSAHVHALEALIRAESDPATLAAAGVMLAVSLGYSPADAIEMP